MPGLMRSRSKPMGWWCPCCSGDRFIDREDERRTVRAEIEMELDDMESDPSPGMIKP